MRARVEVKANGYGGAEIWIVTEDEPPAVYRIANAALDRPPLTAELKKSLGIEDE